MNAPCGKTSPAASIDPALKRFAGACVLALGACAAPQGAVERQVVLLAEAPQRPYEEIARIEARGAPGTQQPDAYAELREKAGALGADAVIKLAERRRHDATPAPHDPPDRPRLGNAYPGPLGAFEPGAFPAEGADLRIRGPYYVVEGIAIRYLD